jgi:hypothetical protein
MLEPSQVMATWSGEERLLAAGILPTSLASPGWSGRT